MSHTPLNFSFSSLEFSGKEGSSKTPRLPQAHRPCSSHALSPVTSNYCTPPADMITWVFYIVGDSRPRPRHTNLSVLSIFRTMRSDASYSRCLHTHALHERLLQGGFEPHVGLAEIFAAFATMRIKIRYQYIISFVCSFAKV
jgi:hypothetical protein